MLGVYIHIPFCTRRCDYCDFFVLTGARDEGEFLDDLGRDLDRRIAEMQGEAPRADSIYLGGGTPSLLDPSAIRKILDDCRSRLHVEPDAEISLEANPENIDADRAAAWGDAGINRLSIGVQSFTDRVLRPRGRLYSAARARASVSTARRCGFENLNIDLIAGLPGEDAGTFGAGLRQLLDLEPEHVSVYLLETGESLKASALAGAIEAGRAILPAEDTIVRIYSAARATLVEAGYCHYEISNFCRPGRASRHNLRYWRSEPYIGIGPSSHSLVSGRRSSRPADLAAWRRAVRTGQAPRDESSPTKEGRAREALILQLRLLEGVDLEAFGRRWDRDPREWAGRELEDLQRAGLLSLRGGRLALTEKGILVSNEIFARLI